MRNIAAFFLGAFIVLTVGYIFLDPALLLISDWLGPLMGSPVLPLVVSAFILFGDPIKFVVLTFIWWGATFLGGLIIRRRVGAVLTMNGLLLFFVPILAIFMFEIFQTAMNLFSTGGLQDIMTLLPPIPQGLSISTLVQAPIFGKLFEQLIGMLETGPPEAFMETVLSLVTPLVISLGEKIVIICVGSLLGVEVGKKVEDRFSSLSEALKLKLGGRSKSFSPHISSALLRNSLNILMILIALSMSVSDPVFVAATENGDFFSENLMGYVDDNGRGFVINLFLDIKVSVEGMDVKGDELEGLLASLIISHDSLVDLIQEFNILEGFGQGLDLGSLVNLIPPTILIVAYLDIPADIAEERSEIISSVYSETFEITLTKVLSFNPPISTEAKGKVPQLTFTLFQSSKQLSDLTDNFSDMLPLKRGGLAEVVERAYHKGLFSPGENSQSADGSAFFTGIINLENLLQYIPLDQLDQLNISSIMKPAFETPLGISGGISYWAYGIKNNPHRNTFDMLHLLGAESEVSFSNEATLSNVIMVGPNQSLEGENRLEGKIIKLTSSAHYTYPNFEQEIQDLSPEINYKALPPGSILDSSCFQLAIEAAMPLNITVEKTVTPTVSSPKSEIQVTVTVTNNDKIAMENVTLDDRTSISRYQTSLNIKSDSPSKTWKDLQPGEYKTHTYIITLGPSGIYTLSPAKVHYYHSGKKFSSTSNQVEAQISRPSSATFFWETMAKSWEGATEALNYVSKGNGTLILGLTTLVLIGLVSILEVKNFRKWLNE